MRKLILTFCILCGSGRLSYAAETTDPNSAQTPTEGKAPVESAKVQAKIEGCASTDPEEMRVLTSLRARRLALDTREAQLDAREAQLKSLQGTLDAKIATMSKNVERLEQRLGIGDAGARAREQRITDIVQTLDTLPAKKAAPILSAAEPQLVTELLRRLGPSRTAALLALMPPNRAAVLIGQASEGNKVKRAASPLRRPTKLPATNAKVGAKP